MDRSSVDSDGPLISEVRYGDRCSYNDWTVCRAHCSSGPETRAVCTSLCTFTWCKQITSHCNWSGRYADGNLYIHVYTVYSSSFKNKYPVWKTDLLNQSVFTFVYRYRLHIKDGEGPGIINRPFPNDLIKEIRTPFICPKMPSLERSLSERRLVHWLSLIPVGRWYL